MHKRQSRIQWIIRWLFGSPFRSMSRAIGGPLPAELRAFETVVETIQRRSNGRLVSPTIRSVRTKLD